MSRDTSPPAVSRRRLLAALAAGVSISVAGCGSDGNGTDTGGGSDDREFIHGTNTGGQDLNPLSIGDEATEARLNLLYDGGGVVDDDPVGFQGRWLRSWELSDDARTVSYEVRDGLEWGAGYGALDAETYVWNVRNVFRSGWASWAQSSFLSVGGDPIEYERTGELTFEAHLPQSRANFLHEDPLLYALPLPKEFVQSEIEPDAGTTPSTPYRQQVARHEDIRNANIVGNLGPFTLESYEAGSRMTVARNDDYYLADADDVDDGAFADSPALERYTYRVFDEQSTAYSAIRSGDITQTGVEARRKAEIAGEDDVTVWTSTYGDGINWISLNHRANGWAPIGDSREVRQGLAHALDTGTLIEEIFDGNANPIDTFHPRWGPYYSDEAIETFGADTELARQKIAAGTPDGYEYDDGALINPDGEQQTLRWVADTTTQTGDLVTNFVRQSLEEVGFDVETTGRPFGELVSTYLRNSVDNNPDFEGEPDYPPRGYNGGPADQSVSAEPWDLLYGVGFSTAAYAPWQAIRGVMTEKGSFNFLGYDAGEYDVAGTLDAAAGASTGEAATAELEELFGFLSRDLPVLWTHNNHRIEAFRRSVGGLPEVRSFFSDVDPRRLSFTRTDT